MPELPEVETLRQALLPLVKNKACSEVILFRKALRFPIPEESLVKGLINHKVSDITRKGKVSFVSNTRGFHATPPGYERPNSPPTNV